MKFMHGGLAIECVKVVIGRPQNDPTNGCRPQYENE